MKSRVQWGRGGGGSSGKDEGKGVIVKPFVHTSERSKMNLRFQTDRSTPNHLKGNVAEPFC